MVTIRKIITCCFFLLLGLQASAESLDPNKASIKFELYNKPMNVTISQGGSTGCVGTDKWDIGVGGCTAAVFLRNEVSSQSCGCTCPQLGSCTASQTITTPVYGWRLPTAGNELVSHRGPPSYGSCSQTSNSCVAAPPPPTPTPPSGGSVSVGTTYKISAMICDSSDPNYSTPPANTPVSIRNLIINQYRGWMGGRCPEASGYINWVGYVNSYAWQYWSPRPGVPDDATYTQAYRVATEPAIDAGANASGEKGPAGISAANYHCQVAANQRYGSTAQAQYVMNSGNSCIVTVP